MENSTIFFILLVVFGTIWYVIKTPSKTKEEVKDDNINRNIQTINKMGYIPEEDDEITGYELTEKPHVEIHEHKFERPVVHLKPNTGINERFDRLNKDGYHVNDHVMSVINKT